MSTQDIRGLREQILANARFLLQINTPSTPGGISSSTTLLTQGEPLEVIVSGEGSRFRGIVTVGRRPAIEGGEGQSIDAALRKLLLAVAETMAVFFPKVGGHMRNIHGGGAFDDDLIKCDSREAQAYNKNG